MKDGKQSTANLTQSAISVVILAMLFVSCSTVESISHNNEAIDTPLTQADSNQTKQTRIIKEEGWQIPSPEKRRKIRTIVSTQTAENGNSVEVISTYYAPNGKFTYSEKPNNPQLLLVNGDLELADFIENRVEKKTYGYTIFARKVNENLKSSNTSPHNHTFVYRIMDQDGDGIFESLVTDSSKILVPEWVIN